MTGWRKSSACSGDSYCVEIRPTRRGVYVRSSTNPTRTVWLTANEWTTFIEAVRAGEFDLDEVQP